ncbi:hypothetical protein CHS0354_019917 [Potamilus streckersoni]|uniref:G-protein coupled receptors family 2 profile 2 domain-containing protein n=1 Tax=Potamilus streckersoni TaxID=2493646 RepID=A0AAE0VY60_9BIVA|nr:hypothetical protein CHS0354_019917 [Potamilus streckersoni]
MEHTSTLNISTSTTSVLPEMNTTFSNDFLPAYTLAITGTSCCLSIFGAIFIAVTYCLLREIRNFPRKLLLYLTFADLLNASGNLMGTIRYALSKEGDKFRNNSKTIHSYANRSEVCIIQSFITTFSSIASFFWTVVIAVYIFTAVVYSSHVFKSVKAECIYHLLSWGIPGVIATTAVALKVLGEDNAMVTASWCWIRSDLEPPVMTSIWMVLAGKGWEILCYLTTMTLYCLLKLTLWKRRTVHFRSLNNEFREEDNNFMFVWFVLYLLRFWGTARFVLSLTAISTNSENIGLTQFVLLNMQGIGDSSQAFWNFIIFCLCDKTVRNGIMGRCQNGSEQTPLISPIDDTDARRSRQ